MNQPMSGDVTSDDKLWAALAYVFTPIVPIIILVMADKKDRPFIKAHNMQALIWGVVLYIIVAVTSAFIIGLCIWPIIRNDARGRYVCIVVSEGERLKGAHL